MNFRRGLIVILLACALLLAGCDRKSPEATKAAAAASATAPASPPVRLPASFQALVDGVDYAVIDPVSTGADDSAPIQVVEAFSYACSHCANFEPKLVAWRARLPADVRFEAVPMPLNDVWTEFARTYYAADDLGVIERTHAALFEAIHAKGVRIDSVDALVKWYAGTAGIDAAAFRRAMYSPGTDARIAGAQARATRWGISTTPSMVIDDRYRITGFTAAQGGFERMLAVADILIVEVRKSRSTKS